MTFREKIFSLGTVYTIVLFTAIFLIIGNNAKKKDDKIKLIEKSGLIFEIGSDTPYSGAIKDTVQDKILEYYLIDGKKYGDFKVSNLNGIVEINGIMNDNKNEGVWNYFYPNGKLESRGTFYNDKLNGLWKWYFPNGNLKAIGYYEDDKKVGTWKFFNDQSKIIREISYRNDNIEVVRSYELNLSI
ncbi:MAG: toxin-antitoxin system YwqK family antitoxin [Ignavibacterium sp.]